LAAVAGPFELLRQCALQGFPWWRICITGSPCEMLPKGKPLVNRVAESPNRIGYCRPGGCFPEFSMALLIIAAALKRPSLLTRHADLFEDAFHFNQAGRQ